MANKNRWNPSLNAFMLTTTTMPRLKTDTRVYTIAVAMPISMDAASMITASLIKTRLLKWPISIGHAALSVIVRSALILS